MQHTTSAQAPQLDDGLMQLHETVMFDEVELDLTLQEMGLETDLPVETQRALLGRAMLCLSLAASVRDEAVFNKSVERLGNIAGDAALNSGAPEAECSFFLDVLKVVGGDLTEELEGESLLDFELFHKRLGALQQSARVEGGLAEWSGDAPQPSC